ncbi:hypothetical protein F5X99DRAFT_75957 [Biscogniauxia marginata]|nr:hypothetical protein F5X99DRAFT_75957 [Biscogniauxia marginata]
MDFTQAHILMTESVERFRATVDQADQDLIENTEVKDVVDAILLIEKKLRERRDNRNLRKLHPFLQGIEKYSKAIDALSNGLSPYLPWAWAPIRLMLQVSYASMLKEKQAHLQKITSDYLAAFDKLLAAYEKIAGTLPQIERLGSTFSDNPTLLGKLALYYADILEFHRRAYKFVRRKSWRFFFLTMWAGFDTRFDAILSSMAAHRDSIHSEAATINIIESKQLRNLLLREVDEKEKDKLNKQRSSIVSWLGLERISQDDECEKLLRDTYQGSSDWFLKTEQMEAWFKIDSKVPVLCLLGKPGAGKSVLSAGVVTSPQRSGMATLSYFCKYHHRDDSSTILKTLLLQLVCQSEDLTAVAYENYVGKGKEPSLKVLRLMLAGSAGSPSLLHAASPCRIVVDGLDECSIEEQKHVIEDLFRLVTMNSPQSCKLFVSSRETSEITRVLQKNSKLCSAVHLSMQQEPLMQNIEGFVRSRLTEMKQEKLALQTTEGIVDNIVHTVVAKANGMFLWVKLVLDSLDDADSMADLHDAITTMPSELSKLYRRIIERMYERKGQKATEKVLRILAWLVFAKRPLKRYEILHGAGITPEYPTINQWTMFDNSVIDKCKPLVEELPDGSIGLVHFTVDEFLRNEHLASNSCSLYSQESIAFACVSIIKDSLVLLEPGISQDDRLIRVVSGSHALLPYALDFWLEHLLELGQETNVFQGSPLGAALSSLESCHCDLEFKLARDPAWRTVFLSEAIDNRLSLLSGTPVYALCASIQRKRDECQSKSVENGAEMEKVSTEKDPTLLSLLAARFFETVHKLLEATELAGVSPEDLENFQRQYSQVTYRCRFVPCRNAPLGFPSAPIRDSHERSHIRRLFCDKPMCPRGRMGFPGLKELAKHNTACHSEGSILVPPRVKGLRHGNALSQSYNDSKNGPNPMKNRTLRRNERTEALSQIKPGTLDAVISQIPKTNEHDMNWKVLYDNNCDESLYMNLRLTISVESGKNPIAFNPAGDRIAIGSDDGTQIFHAHTGEQIRTLLVPPNHDLIGYIMSVSFSPNGMTLAVGDTNGLLRVSDLPS